MTCTNVGQTVNLNPTDYSAFIRYRKSDGYGAFNKCIISTDGKIIFELTEQMLSTVGTSYADLLIMDIAKSDINNDLTIISADGKIIENNASIASTMTFYINVLEKPLNDWDIESTNEFSALNDLLLKATKDYEYIVQTTKEYMDNAKGSENAASQSAKNAKKSEDNAKKSEINTANNERKSYHQAVAAFNSALLSKSYAIGESGYLTNESWETILTSSSDYVPIEARQYEDVENAKYYYLQSAILARQTKDSALSAEKANQELVNLKLDVSTIKKSEDNAKQSELNAKKSEDNAKDSEKKSDINALISQSYAVGNASDWLTDHQGNQIITSDGVALYLSFAREDENTDNAKYYYEQIKAMLDPLQNIILSLTNRITALEEIIETSDLDIVAKFLDHQGNSFITKENEVLRMDTNVV